MDFLHFRLGHCERDAIVEITLRGNAANVRLMDDSNFNSYRNGRQHRNLGGLMQRSPARLQIPHSGQWHVAVDFQGLRGQANVSVNVIPPDVLAGVLATAMLAAMSPRPAAAPQRTLTASCRRRSVSLGRDSVHARND